MSRIRNRKGLTFVEIIVSTLLIAIIAAGSFSAFVGTQQLFNYTRHRLQAFNFTKEAYDRLRSNYAYTDSAMSDTGGGPSHTEAEIGTIIKGEMLNLTSELTYDVDEISDAYKEVTVTVTWTETTL